MTTPKKPSTTRKSTSYKTRFEQTLRMGEILAERNAELERRQAAQAATERKHREAMAGLPPITDKASMDARYARLAKLVGEASFLPEPGKFGGMSESERKRVEEASRRRNLKSKDTK